VLECFESLEHLDYINCQAVLVDNHSVDNTVELVRKRFPAIPIIENSHNLGFAEGNNVGIRYALDNGADYIFLLNDDTVAAPDAISLLVERGEQDSTIGMLGSSVVSYYNHTKEFLGAFVDWSRGLTYQIEYSPNGMGNADHVAGCALMIKAHVAREVGLLDPNYFCYFEDSDWGVRCNRAGYQVVTIFDSKIYHKGTPDVSAHESPSLLFYYRRNQSLFMRKFVRGRRWVFFLSQYTLQCLTQFEYYEQISEPTKADAVISGYWAGMWGRYGASRVHAPDTFKWLARVALKFRKLVIKIRDVLRGA
jgi:GT2 family glycosyltransferase